MLKQSFYAPRNLYRLFLVYAFPLHVWMIIMAFMDFEWVTERTSLWDGIGLIAYALIFVLFETIVFFVFMIILSSLVLPSWPVRKKIALVGSLGLLILFYSISIQAYSAWGYIDHSSLWLSFVVHSAHPLRIIWGSVFLVVSGSVVSTVVLILFFNRTVNFVMDFYERIITLSTLYIFFDLISIVLVTVRNF